MQTPRRIMLDSIGFPVGENLWSFLHEARKRCTGVRFWIDALCIDQSNTKKRNHQVHLMRDIYASAASVAV